MYVYHGDNCCYGNRSRIIENAEILTSSTLLTQNCTMCSILIFLFCMETLLFNVVQLHVVYIIFIITEFTLNM